MFRGLFSQLVAIALGVGILLTFTQPTLTAVGETQDTIKVYRTEKEKVASVNNRLAQLRQEINSIPPSDRQALERYLPDTDNIDNLSIPRDLKFIVEGSGAQFSQAEVAELSGDFELVGTGDETLKPHAVELMFSGTYEQVKRVFQLIQLNDYPLEVYGLDIRPIDQGVFLDVNVTLITYSYEPLVF